MVQRMGDHTHAVQEVHKDLPCLPMNLDICVVEEVSKHLDIPTWEFRATLEHPPIFLECTRTLHQLLVRHNLVILPLRPLFLQQSSETQASLVQ